MRSRSSPWLASWGEPFHPRRLDASPN